MLKRKKSFQIKTRARRKALTDTNYDGNYDEIFENNSLELNRQTPAIYELDIDWNSKSFSETDHGKGNDKHFQDDTFINGIACHGQDNKKFLTYKLNDTLSMTDFKLLQSSLLLSQVTEISFFWPVPSIGSLQALERLTSKWKRLKVSVK